MNDSQPAPLFVLGCPRSGTTLLGAVAASSADVFHVGELAGHYQVANMHWGKSGTAHRKAFRDYLWDRTTDFHRRLAAGRRFWCDSAPVSILAAAQLATRLPDAVFLLVHRDWSGVCRSLERSWRDGYTWAGKDLAERLALWARCYGEVVHLPVEQTLLVRYDEFAASPRAYWQRLVRALQAIGVRGVDPAVLTVSHANGPHGRPTFATAGPGGSIRWAPDRIGISPAVPPLDKVDLVETVRAMVKPGIFPEV